MEVSRPLRLEYPNALYHITSRGDARGNIFLDDTDRKMFMAFLENEVKQQRWICYAWCLMDNHYHLLIETPEANLSRGMQRLNGRYTQRFNRRHERVGHLFQGRYKAILVEKEAHLLELCRYIVLNPVRAGVVVSAEQWPWSSYKQIFDACQKNFWVAGRDILALFSTHPDVAVERYRAFVADGSGQRKPWESLRGQIYLGSDAFLAKHEPMLVKKGNDKAIPLAQRHPSRPTAEQVLNEVAEAYDIEQQQVWDRKTNQKAYQTAVFLLRRAVNLSLKDVGNLAGISPSRVSQIQSQCNSSQLSATLRNLIR